MYEAEFPLLSVDSLGCLPRNFPLARAMDIPSPVRMRISGFELGEGGEDIEEHLSHRIARVVERPTEGQFHISFRKPIGAGIPPISAKRSDIGNTPGLTVEPGLLAHISPLGWAHILLTGEYRWPKRR